MKSQDLPERGGVETAAHPTRAMARQSTCMVTTSLAGCGRNRLSSVLVVGSPLACGLKLLFLLLLEPRNVVQNQHGVVLQVWVIGGQDT